MNIAFFSDTFLPQINGVVTYLVETGLELKKRGHRLLYVVPKCPAGRKNRQIPEGFTAKEFFFVPSVSVNRLYPQWRVALTYSYGLDKAVSRFKPDIIHMHTPSTIGFGAVMASRRFNKPLVGTYHTFIASDEMLKIIGIKKGRGTRVVKKILWEYCNLFYNRCNLVIAPTPGIASILSRNGVKRDVTVLSEGLRLERFKIYSEKARERLKKKFGLAGKKVIVFVGRISREKNLPLMFDAFTRVAQKMPEAHLLLIGDGQQKGELVKLTAKLGIQDRVTFTGFVENAKLIESGMLAAGDLFLTTSKFETFGLSALEAVAFGLPIVAVESQGVAELIEGNGLVSSEEAQDIAGNVIKILTDEGIRERFRERSLILREKYSVEKTTEGLFNLYARIISEFNSEPRHRLPSLSEISRILGL